MRRNGRKSILFAVFALMLSSALVAFQSEIPTGGPIPDRRGFNFKVTDPKAVAEVQVVVRHVAGKVYVVAGAGGNITVFAGDDGVMLVDDNFKVFYNQILAAIRQVSRKPIRFVINTHWHGDHAQNNEALAKQGAVIFATSNTLAGFMAPVDPTGNAGGGLPPGGWPTVTADSPLTFHLNAEEVSYIPLKTSHTNGDVAVYFRGSDVFSFGDVYTTDYPMMDVGHGATVENFIDIYNQAIAMTTPNTIFVPGHAQLSKRADIIALRDALAVVHARIRRMVHQGMTLEQIKAARPSKEFDARFATENIAPNDMQTSARWYQQMYDEAKAHQASH